MFDDMHVVIRAAGERTAQEAERVVRQETGADGLTVVCERPFARALEVGIDAVIRSGKRWAVLMDADVLLRTGALAMIHDELTAETRGFYMLNFLVLDRGFGGPAYAGVHAYDASLFPRTAQYMPLAYKDQRPETRLCKEMAADGFPTLLSTTVVGTHDHEQYLRDLYRKMFVRATKYQTQIPFMAETFRAGYSTDDECKVMLWGLMDGLVHYHTRAGVAPLDTAAYTAASERCLAMLGIRERDALREASVDAGALIARFVPGPAYEANRSWIAPANRVAAFPSSRPRGPKVLHRIAGRVKGLFRPVAR